MKSNIYIKQIFVLLLVWISTSIYGQNFTPIQLNTAPNTASCTSDGSTFTASVPSEVLSGDNIPLNITIPGTLDPTCDVDISINYSSPNNKLQYVTSSNVAFTSTSGSIGTTNPLPGNDGRNFNIFFKFPNWTTCDGETGTFDITFNTCNGSCNLQVQVVARADNYWTVKKSFVAGNAVCGISKWRVDVSNNNPNPSNHGNYKINGTIAETTSLPVIGASSYPLNTSYGYNTRYFYIKNCQNAGTTITNTVHYSFSLGDNCGVFEGDVTADSPPLVAPNANISFTKTVLSSSGVMDYSNGIYNISAGCQGYYYIQVYNNGNTIWNIQSITDAFPAEITITSFGQPTGFSTPQLPPPNAGAGTFTWTASGGGYDLYPGQSLGFQVYFTVDNVPNGTIVTNNATLHYQSGSVNSNNGGGNSTSCQGVNCPSVDNSVHNENTSVQFKVVEPFPVEILKKCIKNPSPSNIYNVGDIIHFSYLVSNAGSASLNTSLNDILSLPGQNLQLDPSSLTYNYYPNQYYNPYCGTYYNPQPPASVGVSITSNTSDLQNPIININNLPGNCQLNKANILEVKFDAIVLAQNYGNKTNTVKSSHDHQSSVNYTIDQNGVFEIEKRADQEFVDAGGSFNYIIEVTNSGSVALDHISISDNLPSCVNLQQGISVKDMAGNSINYTTNGSLNIDLDSTTQLSPAETFTITIPVVKSGGGNCCNESVTAHGTMVTSGVVLETNNGSADQPAACVKSMQCCDIPDFEAHLYDNGDGTYNVSLNGGTVPIQQVDVSVIDYHVEYNQRDCKPQDMGIFGNLSTNSVNLDGLLLDTNTNNTANLTWKPGNPAVLNSGFDFTISKPNVLDLECCKADFYFCLKVTVKDVNCNVCQKVICAEPKEEPCELSIRNVNDQYCNGDDINIQWSGSNTGGSVDIILVPQSGGSNIQIATNQPESGNLTWSIPQNIKPCGGKWKIMIVDTDNRECGAISNIFVINCCHTCDCGSWQSHEINVNKKIIFTPHDDTAIQKKNLHYDQIDLYDNKSVACGKTLYMNQSGNYTFTAPVYQCSSEDCQVTYKWHIDYMENGQNIHQDGIGNQFSYNLNAGNSIHHNRTYHVSFTPVCGGKECKPCSITVSFDKELNPHENPRR